MCQSYRCPLKYSGIFYKVLEMPLQDINTSVQYSGLYSKILSLVLFKPDNGLTVRPPYPAVSAIISLSNNVKEVCELANTMSDTVICLPGR